MVEKLFPSYETPIVEILEVIVEQGFANSFTENMNEKDPLNW